jgi:hypothetical protein
MTSPEFGAVAFVTPLSIFGRHYRRRALTCGDLVRNVGALGDRLVTPQPLPNLALKHRHRLARARRLVTLAHLSDGERTGQAKAGFTGFPVGRVYGDPAFGWSS